MQAVWGPDTDLGDVTWASRFSDATRQVEHYRLSALMHTGRGLLLDLTGNDYLTGSPNRHSSLIDVCRATTTVDIDVTAALLRPDGHICWLTSATQRCDPASADLHAALEQWCEPAVTKDRAGPSP